MDLRQTAGLLMFFIVYVVVGGIVFMILESQQEPPHKLKEKQFYDFEGSSIYILLKYQMTADYLFSNADQLKQFNISDYSRMKLMEMARKSFKDNEEEYADKWGFFNSFFFAITVVTTIGYGHLSPTTSAGRLFCIIYAILGIPMTGILLGAIGDRFSKCFLEKVSQPDGH